MKYLMFVQVDLTEREMLKELSERGFSVIQLGHVGRSTPCAIVEGNYDDLIDWKFEPKTTLRIGLKINPS